MKYPYKYFLDEEKIVWEKKFFFQKKTTIVEINLKDIQKIIFLPGSMIYDVSTLVVSSRIKKIKVLYRSGSLFTRPENKHIAEYDTLVCTLLEKIRDNRNIRYVKGHIGGLIAMAILWVVSLPTTFFSWQLVYSYINKGDFMQLISFSLTPIAATAFVILGPLFIMRLIPKSINPEHILRYSPKVLFNKRYRKYIHEETGMKIG